MMRFVVTGTDTGIGKTIFSAALAAALGGFYWKPVQSGLDEETDSQTVHRLGRLPPERIFPETYRLRTPASPHLAARIDHVSIDTLKLTPPLTDAPFVIEGAGGLLVPLTKRRSLPMFSHAGRSRSSFAPAPGSARSTTRCCRSKHCATAPFRFSALPSSAMNRRKPNGSSRRWGRCAFSAACHVSIR